MRSPSGRQLVALLVVVVVAAALGALPMWLMSGGGPVDPSLIERVHIEVPPTRHVAEPPVDSAVEHSAEEEEDRVVEFKRELARLERDCGLGLTGMCDDDMCVAGTSMPVSRGTPMDDLRTALRWPKYVASDTVVKVLGLPQEALPCTAALRFWPPATVERGPTSYLCTGFADGPEGSATLAELKKYLWMCDAFHGTGTAFKTDYAGYIQRRVDESR